MSQLSSADESATPPEADDQTAQSSADENATPPEAEEQPPVDEVRQGMLDVLTRELGDAIVGTHIEHDDLWVRVDRGSWRRAVEACRGLLECDYFCFLSGIDWMSNPNLSGEKLWDPEAEGSGSAPLGALVDRGYAGGDTRFQVFARLYSIRRKWGVTLKADLDDDDPRIESITSVYRGADWHEREAWEMYGFEFDGHPGLRHLYLPTEFEGHPLRKDFPLLSREVKPWPGLVDKEPIPGEDENDDAAESEAS